MGPPQSIFARIKARIPPRQLAGMRYVRFRFARAKAKVWSRCGGGERKGEHELAYWRERTGIEGTLRNAHYETLYTDMFRVDRDFYRGKRVLDIGCGPRGSLEWAIEAQERVGLDPLVEQYKDLGIHRHAM